MKVRAVQTPRNPSSRGWSRVRVQLGGGLLASVVLPVLSLIAYVTDSPGESVLRQTTIGLTVAVLLGFYLFRNMTTFPGMRAAYYIMPCFLISYGVVLVLFLFFRWEYSRGLFLSSFVASIAWFYLIDFVGQRRAGIQIGVVPFGAVTMLDEVRGIRWIWLKQPVLNRHYDALVADFRADLADEWESFLAEAALAGTAVFHVKQLREALTGKVEIEHLSENSFGSLVPFMAYLKIRRIFDFVAACIVGLLLLPFLLFIALLIRLDSPGGALFRQRRTGYRGRPFVVVKFRTMNHSSIGAASDRDGAITSSDDPRVTRLGRFLRRTRIDELPQIWNILKGEMSWIGPRPEAEVLSRWYEGELPFYRYRHIVPPGITGWAQVNQGHVSELDLVGHKLNFDFYYIKNFSPWLDILILIRTVKTVFTGLGAK